MLSKTIALLSLLTLTSAQVYGPAPASSPTTTAAAAAVAASSAAPSGTTGSSSTKTITAGAGGITDLSFTPPMVTANAGEFVEIHFGALNHSFAESSFATPCEPLNSSSIFAGFNFAVSSGMSNSVFTIAINDSTTPIWFYCPQSIPLTHCTNGMVGVINPPAGKTITQFVAAAKNNATLKVPTVVTGGTIGTAAAAASSSGSSSGSAASPSATGSSAASHFTVEMGLVAIVCIAFSAMLSF